MIPTAVQWGFCFTEIIIIRFETQYDTSLEVMLPCFILSTSPYIKIRKISSYWRVSFKIQTFARFSLVSLSIHLHLRRGAERIDQQQQQSVGSAIVATTKQSVRITTTVTLIITSTFRRASTFRLWGYI